MPVLRIVLYPDQSLRRVSTLVDLENDEHGRKLLDVQHLMDCMVETMRSIKGLGLSAIQVAVPWRVVVVETSDPEKPLHMINPEILEVSEDMVEMEEGCLSFPGAYAVIGRPSTVKIQYHDYNGELAVLEAETLIARCILHEIDHLDGKVFIDYLRPVARDVVTRKMKKMKKMIAAEREKMLYAAQAEAQRRQFFGPEEGADQGGEVEEATTAPSTIVSPSVDDNPAADSDVMVAEYTEVTADTHSTGDRS